MKGCYCLPPTTSTLFAIRWLTSELIRERVMLEARRMLLHDVRTIAKIGHYLSFPDHSYFSRFFKKYESISPEKFRKKYNRI